MSGPLDGVLVVELARALAGPHAGMLLGDLGARVIKIEAPGHGDDTRGWGPPFVDPGHGRPVESTYFMSANRNKESVELDLKSDTGRSALQELARRADVLIENFRPGVMDRLGFGSAVLHDLNERLVVLSITGFGRGGPEGGRPGYDQIVQGEAGLMSLTGPDTAHPLKVGVPIADLLAGLYGAYGVLAALHERDRTGQGRVVHTSLLSSVVGVHAFQATMWTVAGARPTVTGNHHPAIAPYGLFNTGRGQVQLAVGSESLWRRFADRFELECAQWATNGQRVGDREALIAAVEDRFAGWTADELLEVLADLAVPAGLIREIPEVYGWEQLRSQGLLLEVDHRHLGPVTLPGNAVRFDDEEFTAGRRQHAAPPVLGQHTATVLDWLGVEGRSVSGDDSPDVAAGGP